MLCLDFEKHILFNFVLMSRFLKNTVIVLGPQKISRLEPFSTQAGPEVTRLWIRSPYRLRWGSWLGNYHHFSMGPSILTTKDFFSWRDVNDNSFGSTLILSPSGDITLALYLEFGDPTLVTVLWKIPLNDSGSLIQRAIEA